MLKQEITEIIEKIVGQKVELEHPANLEFGDYSTNIALKAKIDAKQLAEKLSKNEIFEKVEVAGPGFINLYLSKGILQKELKNILETEDKYGDLKIGKGKKIQVEFISANPTGLLTVANARGGPYGDTLANVLRKAGYETKKAYYVNNHGVQILTLGHSVLKDKEAQYKGEYVDKLNKENIETDPYKVGQWAAEKIVKDYLKKTTDKLGIEYDDWFFESEIHESGWVDETLDNLKKDDLTYEADGATWFKSEQLGDNRDRVIIKKDGKKTYLAGDIAYHRYKFEKDKFDKVINIWGADHHGDIAGLMAGVEAIGHKDKLEIILLQFVTLLEKGEKKRMSKRAGVYVLMDELLDEVDKDAVRFMFLQKSPDTHLNFDIALAKEQSKNNPVFYVQYAYARICSILNNSPVWIGKGTSLWVIKNSELNLLTHLSELNLIRQLVKYPEIIEMTANDYQVQRLPQYAMDLAGDFHRFYESCRVMDIDNQDLTYARLSLLQSTQIVLKNILDLIGVDAPEKM
ncbi:MAG: arginine--tRNA ligase [bacterium]